MATIPTLKTKTAKKVHAEVLACFNEERFSEGGWKRLDEIMRLTLGRYFNKKANARRWGKKRLHDFVLSCAGQIAEQLHADARRASRPRVQSVSVYWMRKYEALSDACGPTVRDSKAIPHGPLCDPFLDSL